MTCDHQPLPEFPQFSTANTPSSVLIRAAASTRALTDFSEIFTRAFKTHSADLMMLFVTLFGSIVMPRSGKSNSAGGGLKSP